MTGFIEDNARFIQDIFPTYPAWAEALALFQVACANPFARIRGRGPGLPVSFNPWAIGPSRFGYKSTPLKDIVEPTLGLAGLYMLPPRFTVEGYYSLIHGKEITHAILIRDETAGIVAEQRKEYLADEFTFLSELLDGRISSRVTVKHGELPGRDIRVNFATATTPHVLTMLDAGFWVQGLGNRLTPIYYTSAVVDSVPAETDDSSFHSFLKQYAGKLKEFYETRVSIVNVDEAVRKAVQYEEYSRREKAYSEYFDDKLDIIPAMYFECQVQAQKVAALRAIDRQPNCREPVIEMEDYEWSKKWVGERFSDYEVLVKDWINVRNRKRTATIFTTPEQRIYRKLMKYKGGLTKTQLNNLTHLSAEQREEALKKLIGDGTVEEMTIFMGGEPKKGYRIKIKS